MTTFLKETREGRDMANDTRAELEREPSSLATQAAVQLDNLIRGRTYEVSAVRRLGELIKEEFERSANRPTTVGVMKRAIDASNLDFHSLAKVEDVRRGAEQVADTLLNIAANPEQKRETNPDEIERMREFCIHFSTQRSAIERPRIGKPKHPYRR